MANYAVVVDPDPARRTAARRLLEQRIAPFPHLELGSAEVGNVLLVWAITPEAPRRISREQDVVELLLGQVVEDPDRPEPSVGPVADGFHVAIHATGAGTVSVRTDLLGLFPVYYGSAGRESFLVGSSPYLLQCHPDFATELEPRAIVGLLLANATVNGISLYRGVRRLRGGYALHYGNGTLREEEAYRVPVTDALHRLPAAECAARLGEALEDACRRHLPPGSSFSLLLSGGLDSRLLAGTLAPLHPGLLALTYGIRSDLEARYARRVARTLGLRHVLLDHAWAPEAFPMTIRWDALMASPGSGAAWLLPPVLRRYGPRLASGYVMDSVFGASVERSYDPVRRISGFQPWLATQARWGIPRDQLRSLLRREVFGDALEETERFLAADYQAMGEHDMERARRVALAYRMRFFTGAPLWRQAFGSWPVNPSLDRAVFAATGGCPLNLLAGRRLEKDLLCRNHPRLAIIPLDQNSYDDRALDPRLRDLIGRELREQWARALKRLTRGRWRRKERRYYQRTHNFNGTAWRSIRASLEPHRRLAYELFDPVTFDRLLPPADAVWQGQNSIEDAAGMKSLLGIVAWLRDFGPRMPPA